MDDETWIVETARRQARALMEVIDDMGKLKRALTPQEQRADLLADIAIMAQLAPGWWRRPAWYRQYIAEPLKAGIITQAEAAKLCDSRTWREVQ